MATSRSVSAQTRRERRSSGRPSSIAPPLPRPSPPATNPLPAVPSTMATSRSVSAQTRRERRSSGRPSSISPRQAPAARSPGSSRTSRPRRPLRHPTAPRERAPARLHGRLPLAGAQARRRDRRSQPPSPVVYEGDRERDAVLQLHGFRIVRFTSLQIDERPRWVAETTLALLA